MVLVRKIVFFIFSVLFILCAPMIVLYSLGYLFKPGEVQGLIKTGVVHLSTIPRDADVYLGRRRYSARTPTTLRDLSPGSYDIRLVKKGYHTWSQKVPVIAGQATVLDKIILMPEGPQKVLLSREGFEDLMASGSNDFFFSSRGPKAKDLFCYHWKEDELVPVVRQGSEMGEARVLNLWTERGSAYALLELKEKMGIRFYWIHPLRKEVEIQDLSSLFVEPPGKINWPLGQDDYLFAYQNDYLNRLDISSQSVFPRFVEDLRGYGFFHKTLYTLHEDGSFYRSDLEGRTRVLLAKDPELFGSLFTRPGFVEIRVLAKNLILFRGSQGTLAGNRLPYTYVDQGVLGFEYNPKTRKVLLWQKTRIGILNFAKDEEKVIFEKAPEVKWIYEEGDHIQRAFWIYQGSHVLFLDRARTYLIELAAIGKPHLYELVDVKRGSGIEYAEENGRMYYLDANTGALAALKILAKEEINFLTLPEFDREPNGSKSESS